MFKQPFKQIYYLAPDNTKLYFFENKTRALQSWQNFGMPEINFIEDRGPNQHGTTVRDWRAQTRTITLEWFGQNCDGRQCEYATVIEKITPTQDGSPGYLRVFNQDTSLLEIPAWIQQGPSGDWSIDSGLRNLQVRDALQFHCPDPIWRAYSQETVLASPVIQDSCLPMCLPACLGSGLLSAEINVCYNGSWPGDQLTFTITGPIDAPTITNNTTGRIIQLNYNVAANETITITVLPELATVTSDLNGNIIGTVTDVSDLVFFTLAPRQINVIDFSGANAIVGASSITMSYYTRYISVYDTCYQIDCGDSQTYATVLRENYGATEIWPLVNISAGTAIHATINSTRNGVQTGWDLQANAGPVIGSLAPFTTTNDYGDIFTAGSNSLQSIFNGSEGSIFMWAKALDWTAGTRVLLHLFVDANNLIIMQRSGTNLAIGYSAGGTLLTAGVASGSPTGWFSIGMSWSAEADEVKMYYNGVQVDTTKTGLGVFAGSLDDAFIGALSSISSFWQGNLAYTTVKFGSVWSGSNFLAMHQAAENSQPD